MLSQWLERARAGEPVWLPDMRAQCAQLPDPIDVTMQLTLCDGTQRDFPLPLPRWESDDQRQFVLQYVTACVWNTLSALSGRELAFYFDPAETETAALLGKLDTVFQVHEPTRREYGKVVSIADRLCRAFGCGPFAFALRDKRDYVPAPPSAAKAVSAAASTSAARTSRPPSPWTASWSASRSTTGTRPPAPQRRASPARSCCWCA